MAAKIFEFKSAPEIGFDAASSQYVAEKWCSTISVDVKWVSAAQPGIGISTTDILLAGSGQWRTIDCPYPDFMKKWQG